MGDRSDRRAGRDDGASGERDRKRSYDYDRGGDRERKYSRRDDDYGRDNGRGYDEFARNPYGGGGGGGRGGYYDDSRAGYGGGGGRGNYGGGGGRDRGDYGRGGGRDYDSRGDRGGRDGGGGRGGGRDHPEPLRRSRTPEGTRKISERVRATNNWDVRPKGFEEVTAQQAKATGMFNPPGLANSTGGGGLPILRLGAGGPSAEAMASVAGANASNRGARRLYIGNIGATVNENSLCSFFNMRMQELNFTVGPGEPVLAAQVNPDKGWAFVEFRSPEETTNAMGFDGIVFQGSSLKIRRPKDYVGPDVNPPSSVHVPGVISTNVPDGPNKIYVGGLPTYLQDEQIIELLKSFGELRAFNLVREAGNGASKGFAFCEYVDPNLTDLACQGLNDMELGDRKLVVQRASMTLDRKTMNAPGVAGTGSNMAPLGSMRLPGGDGPGEPTRALTMLNMVTPEELLDDVEYGEILEDIRDECSKFGTLLDIRIPRPVVQSKGAAAQTWKRTVDGEPVHGEVKPKEREGVGRVFVKFSQVAECQKALRALAGRQFGGRTVICAHLNEDDWPSDEDGGMAGEETA